jgi:hypothetical protein
LSESLLSLLAGKAGFVPYGWSRLPSFLQLTAPANWWSDPDYCQRALTEFGSVCRAEALMIPVLDEHIMAGLAAQIDEAEDPVEAIAESDVAAQVLALVAQMVSVGRFGVVTLLPTSTALREAVHEIDPEDAEDALCDLARSALNTGAAAVAVRGEDEDEVATTVRAVAKVADYFGTVAIGITPGRSWVHDDSVTVAVIAAGRPWPSAAITVTYDDLSNAGSAAEVHRWASERGTQ